ncbi:unnamed protein product [Calypogeia fissa]
MNGTTRYFWMHFVQQGRLINESIADTNTPLFSKQVEVLYRVETLYFHLTERGDWDRKYKDSLDQGWIPDLFYGGKEGVRELTIVEAIKHIPTHIYKLPGTFKLTMELVRDVGVKNYSWPKDLEVPKQDDSAERRGVGTTNPHSVGLPSLAVAAAQVAAQDLGAMTKKEAPKGTPQRKEGRPQWKVNVKPERVASPPQSSARAFDKEDVQIISRGRRPIDIIDEEEDRGVKSTKIRKVNPEIVSKAQQANHHEFWAEMGLENFVGLEWDCTGGTLGQCEEFLRNYNKTSTKVNNRVLDLSEKRLAFIFKLGEPKNRTASLRAKQWKSANFFGPKEKNRYKWSQCTDPEMVERLEFMRCAMYIMEKKSTISGSMVREVEEVLGGSTDWAKHFHKQFHHEVESLRLNRKLILGSHLRIILC